MADKKQKGQLLSDFLKRAQEKQSESRVQSRPFRNPRNPMNTITVYGGPPKTP